MFLVTVIVPHHLSRDGAAKPRRGASRELYSAPRNYARRIYQHKPTKITNIDISAGSCAAHSGTTPSIIETSFQRRVSRPATARQTTQHGCRRPARRGAVARAARRRAGRPACPLAAQPLTSPAGAVKTQLKISSKFGAMCARATRRPWSSRLFPAAKAGRPTARALTGEYRPPA